jgi:S1-C subfamily serine protease
MVVGSVVMIVLSLMITGTILAQGNGGHGGRGADGAWLGVTFEETDGSVVVSEVVDGSPAADAGLLAGDVIVSVDGEAVDSGQTLSDLVRAHQPGDVISIVVTRDGSEMTLEVTLSMMAGRGLDDITADTDPLTAAEWMLHVSLEAVDGGYQVVDDGRMRPDSTLVADDIITAVNGTAIAEVDWPTLFSESVGQNSAALTLTVLRGGEEVEVTLEQFGGAHGRDMGGHGGMMGQPGQSGTGTDGSQTGTAPHPVVPDNTSSDSLSA